MSTQSRQYNWAATWQLNCTDETESLEYGRRDQSRWPRFTLYPQKLAHATEISFLVQLIVMIEQFIQNHVVY
jgi:hypothetical protein